MTELYQIRDDTGTGTGIKATVLLNPDHPLFGGHFPGQPVLPGVCMMELICAVASKESGRPFRITGGPLIKFLHMVDPRQTPEFQVEMTLEETGQLATVEGRLLNGPVIFVRFRLELTAHPE